MNNKFSIIRLFEGYFRLVFHSLLHRMLRASLTVVGIVIGISIVLSLVFLGNGLQQGITGQLQQLGNDLIFTLPSDASNPLAGATGGGEFDDDHVEALEQIEGVQLVMPIVTGFHTVAKFRGEEKTVAIDARPLAMVQEVLVESQGIELAEGRWMSQVDAREIVIGENIANEVFRDPIKVGDSIDILGRRLEVVGILEQFGDSARDNFFIMTIFLFQQLSGQKDGYGGILTKVDDFRDIEFIGREMDYVLSLQDDLEDYTVLTPDRSEEVISGIIGTVQSALFLIASVAVLVAGIGVMNTMYTAVLERTREVGIMKSVGAKSWHIMLVFLLESMIIGAIGGGLGLLGGAGFAELIAWIARQRGFSFFESAVDLPTIVFVLVFTMAVGLFAGVLPARQAAKKKPVEALRYR